MKASDLPLLTSVSRPSIHPDGTLAVFATSSPNLDADAYVGQLWTVPLDGSSEAKRLFFARGENASPEWSPDGRRLAFVSNRGGHSIIAVYTSDSEPIRYLAPSTSRDRSPRWSRDGKRVAFVRAAGSGRKRCWSCIRIPSRYGLPM